MFRVGNGKWALRSLPQSHRHGEMKRSRGISPHIVFNNGFYQGAIPKGMMNVAKSLKRSYVNCL